MKKVLLTAALAGLSVFGLTSCKGPKDGDTIDAIILYKENSGMSFLQADATKGVGGEDLKKGEVLPMWKELEKKFGVTFKDVADYSQTSTKNSMTKYMQDGYVGKTGTPVELIQGTNETITQMANQGRLIALDEHLDKMPNFAKYLEENPSIKAQLTRNKHIYNTPYFDGVDSVEKYLILNGKAVKALLDSDASVTETKSMTTVYTPFYEYKAGQKVLVTNKEGNDAQTIILGESSVGKSSIDAQNKLASDGLTSQEAIQTLRTYIDDTYRYNEELKALYKNRSDVFLSASACYNVDDLIALFRAAKLNPVLCGGQDSSTDGFQIFITRDGKAGREKAVTELAAFFGVRGTSSEYKSLYFDEEGNLHDAKGERRMYDALQNLNEIYQEGLIVQNYNKGYGGTESNEFRKGLMPKGNSFASYDYTGTTSPYVTYKEPSKEPGKEEPNYGPVGEQVGYTAVLPPVANWTDNYNLTKLPNGDTLEAGTMFHFTEDVRSLKDGGTAIPANANPELLDKVFEIVDYFYTDEGADLQDFGPNTTDYRNKVTKYDEKGNRLPMDQQEEGALMLVNEKPSVVISEKVFNYMTEKGKMWNDFYRQYVGSTHGVGHIRNDGLDMQNMDSILQKGMKNVETAIKAGSMFISKSTQEGFFKVTPSVFALSNSEISDIDTKCKNIENNWKNEGEEYGPTKFIINSENITNAKIEEILSADNVANFENFYLKAYNRAYKDSFKLNQ